MNHLVHFRRFLYLVPLSSFVNKSCIVLSKTLPNPLKDPHFHLYCYYGQ
nr:MAG TPA: hypothetical protein [Caudoviricetes sp.]